MKNRTVLTCGLLATLLTATALTGCKKDEAKETQEPVAAAADTAAPAASAQAVEAILARADAFDGKVDKVVTKCPACALYMDGLEEHKLEAHGYTMYFCSAHCVEQFAKDPDASILAMQFPEEESD